MLIKDAIARFRQLHQRHKQGSLSPDEEVAYRALCDDFCRALVGAQRLGLQAGQKARQTVRVATAKKIELAFPDNRVNTMTYDPALAALLRSCLTISPSEVFAISF